MDCSSSPGIGDRRVRTCSGRRTRGERTPYQFNFPSLRLLCIESILIYFLIKAWTVVLGSYCCLMTVFGLMASYGA